MKVITMEDMKKRIENTRTRSTIVFQRYNSNSLSVPPINAKKKKRDPDERIVLERFKLK